MFLISRLVAAILMVLAIEAHVARGQPKDSDAFVFTEADLKLLQESDAVEGLFDRLSLLCKYLSIHGTKVLPNPLVLLCYKRTI